ncbi:MAG: protein kinase [Schaedlerella sp.]|nr:protein kinase [Schaedlerella sp.]
MSGLEQFSETYEIRERLGEGSGGVVYRAYHKRLKKVVVLKKMKNVSISGLINRQEVDILKDLNHTFLPQVFDFLTIGNDIYTVMSYIPGKSFQQMINEGYTFSQNQLIQWGMQLLSALNYLHSQNPPIIHSDIKPANIMLTPEGNICLIDFNISFFLDANTVLGYSTGYTSPEQYILALDSRNVQSVGKYSTIDEKSDLYSVGATLYHLATGIKKESYKTPINRELLVQRTSEAFAQVIIRSMQINPENRFPSAFVMFQAMQGITKRDERYKKLLKRQRNTRIAIVLMMAGFIVLGGVGIHEMNLERVDKYNELVEQQIKSREDKDYEEEDAAFEEAVSIMPSELETYYQKACTLYQQREYEECIDFIDYDILENEKIDQSQHKMADVYYLKADSHFQLEEYSETIDAYEELMEIGTLVCEHYRDYAIALAYDGSSKKAEAVLEDAIDYGLEEDSIYYAKAEIEKSMGRTDDALLHFEESIERTDNDELKARAYVLCSKIYEERNSRENEREILLEAEREVPVEYQMLILERLIQADIDIAESRGNDRYREEAIEKLHKVIEQGWDTYETYDNLVILNEKLGNIYEAEEIVWEMAELFGEDYNIYKRLAFLEINRQELLENRDRDYSVFSDYYNRASELYYEQLNNSSNDLEMELLDNVYNQVIAGGWL